MILMINLPTLDQHKYMLGSKQQTLPLTCIASDTGKDNPSDADCPGRPM